MAETSNNTIETSEIANSIKKRSITQIVLSILGFLLFAMFSSLQANDVSQYGTAAWLTDAWLMGYASLALLCLYNAIRPLPAKVFLALAAITFALAIFRGSQINWNNPLFCFTAPKEFAERNPAGNETGGLIVMTLWLLLLFRSNKKQAASNTLTANTVLPTSES